MTTDPATNFNIHHPRPAIVATTEGCGDQRYFGSERPLRTADGGIDVVVMRFSDENIACIKLEYSTYWHSRATVTAAQLRELAARLIDAAHDIETFPAPTAEVGAA